MSESKRNKAGLHKKISSIFKGIPVQQNDDVQQPHEVTESQSTNHTEPAAPSLKPQAPEPQEPQFIESKQSLVPEPVQSPSPKPEETQEQESKETQDSEPKENLVLIMDKPNALETQEIQALELQKAQSSKPKKPVILKMDEPDALETQEPQAPEPQEAQVPKPEKSMVLKMGESDSLGTQEFQAPEPQEIQTSKLQKPPVPESEQVIKPLPENKPSQEPKADIEDSTKIPTGKLAIVKITGKHLWQQIEKKLLAPKPGVNPVKQKAMFIIVPLLFVVLIFMLRGVFGTSVRKTEAAAENNASGVTANSNNKIEWDIPALYPKALRDPLQLGPVETSVQAEINPGQLVQLTVKGILYTEDNPSAAVNGRIVHEGEKIRGATVAKITKESVEFEIDGKRWTQKVR